jgi:predicted O-linked N-acetylglucosamine transferase (SPINDLY family)
LSDDQIANMIVADRIDILVDMKGYTLHTRSSVLRHRPAPVQMNYLGYPGTMGARFVDFIVADHIVIPADLEQHYVEKVLRLPHCYQPNDRKRPLPPAPTREAAGLPPTGFVFCSFNNTYKITPDVFAIWRRLLQAVPGSVLWALTSNAETNSNLRKEMSRGGLDPERLILAPRVSLAAHLARFRLADLFLDTLPYTAHTTASDSLWCGVPVVTRIGDTFASRVAASILHAADLPELVTTTEQDYEQLALKIAREPDVLARLKRHLDEVRLTCPLFDSVRYTRDLERLYDDAMTSRQ